MKSGLSLLICRKAVRFCYSRLISAALKNIEANARIRTAISTWAGWLVIPVVIPAKWLCTERPSFSLNKHDRSSPSIPFHSFRMFNTVLLRQVTRFLSEFTTVLILLNTHGGEIIKSLSDHILLRKVWAMRH